MNPAMLAFFVGLVIGASFGMVILSILIMGRRADDEAARECRPEGGGDA